MPTHMTKDGGKIMSLLGHIRKSYARRVDDKLRYGKCGAYLLRRRRFLENSYYVSVVTLPDGKLLRITLFIFR